MSTEADIAWGGGAAGAGKSFVLLLDFTVYAEEDECGGVIFRRTMPQIKSEGGLWDTSESLFMSLVEQARPKPNTVSAHWTFPNGNKLSFSHLQHEKNIFDWQGTQIPYLGFDELTHFTEKMYWYLISRSRSSSNYRPRVRCTMNPQADGWVKDFLVSGGYVYPDDYHVESLSSYPVMHMAGVVRYFLRYKGEIIWGDTKKDVAMALPESVRGDFTLGDVKSFTFIPGKLDDNPILLKDNPGYRGNLLAQSEEDQAQLLGGRWAGAGDDRLKLIETPSLRDLFSNTMVPGGDPVITADIAMEGRDEMIVRIWDGWILTHTYRFPYTMGDEVLNHLKRLAKDHGVPGKAIVFDAGGVGNYLKGFMRSSIGVMGGARPYPVKDSEGKSGVPNYANVRSQLAFYVRDKITDYETYCALPKNSEDGAALYRELNALYKKETAHNGKQALETRDLLKARLGGKSPDHCDSFILRAAYDLAPRSRGSRSSSSG